MGGYERRPYGFWVYGGDLWGNGGTGKVFGRLRAPPVRVCFFRAATSAARTGFGFMVLILRLCQLKSLTVISFTSYIVAESVSKQKLF